ncbi:MAG: peroxiredoxin [Alphaproteobacteria bacterium]|jgi:peroxiredoxin|nr:peroxiredoxin [Alphaproteobacteria bacterium]MDP6517517.1 peroxiredoxin [Alphaproteobacteria bacterium]
MTIKVGDKLPAVTFKHLGPDGMGEITTDDLFAGKKAVLFALPGAFTPTCSSKHVPGFMSHAGALEDKGIETIVCLSVNDPFVMAAWAKDLGSGDTVTMVADGNGDFTRAVGLELDGRGFGLGERSQRYAMVVDNGAVTKLAVEDGPGLDVSSAENILAGL